MIKLKSIKIKLLLVFLLVGLLPLVIFGLLDIRNSRADLQREISNKLLLLSEAKEGQVFAFLDSIQSRTIDFASDDFIKDSLKEIVNTGSPKAVEALNRHLINNKKPLDETLAGIFIMGPNGRVVASTNVQEVGKDESNDKYFQEGRKGVFAIEVRGHEHFNLTNPLVVTAPLTDKETGKLLGVIANVFDVEKVQDILSGKFQLEKGALSGERGGTETLEVYLVNNEKAMFVHPGLLPGHEHKNHSPGMKVETLPVQKCLDNQEEMAGIYTNYRGEKVTGASMCITKLDWVLLTEIHTKEAFVPINKMQFRLVLITFLFGLLIIVAALVISNTISRPIKKLQKGTEIIGRGNLDYKMNIKTQDEIGQLARAFDKMTEDLKETTTSLDKLNEEIAERKRIEEELHRSEETYRTLTQTSPDCIKLFSLKGKLLFINESGLKEHRFKSLDEVLGSNWNVVDTFMEEDRPKFKKAFEDAVKGKITSIEVKHTKEGANREICLLTLAPLKDEKGNVVSVFGVSRDITERKKMEKQLFESNRRLQEVAQRLTIARDELKEAIETKGEFMNIVAHELKTPLQPIMGYADRLLNTGEPTQWQKDRLAIILANAKQLRNLVQDVLDINKMETGVMKFSMEELDLLDIVKQVYESFKPVAEAKKLGFILDVPKTLGSTKIIGDPSRLNQALSNLLDNAIKFTDKGSIIIKIAEDDNTVAVSVSDTGAGIAKDDIPKLFTKFFQADASAKRRQGGTGLGLAISKEIVKAHKGDINAQSTLGKGSTFTITLPKLNKQAKRKEV